MTDPNPTPAGRIRYGIPLPESPPSRAQRTTLTFGATGRFRASRQLDAADWLALYTEGGAIPPPFDPQLLWQLYEQCVPHAACIDAVTEDAVSRGWDIVSRSPDQKPEQGLFDGVMDWLDSICPEQTFSELLAQAVREELAIGWAAWEVARENGDPTGQVAALYPIPAFTVRATRDPNRFVQLRDGQVRHFARFGSGVVYDCITGDLLRDPSGVPEDRRSNEVIWFHRYSARSRYYGVPGWIASVPTIAELAAIREFNISFFASGGLADRIIHATADNSGEAKRIAESLQATFEANQTGHASAFTYGTKDSTVAVEFLVPNVGERDGQFQDRRRELVEEVLIAHGVPPYRVGIAMAGNLGGNAADAMIEAYYLGKVEPTQETVETRLRRDLFGPAGRPLTTVRWRLKDVSIDRTTTDLTLVEKLVPLGALSPNEARDRFNLPASDGEGMNDYYVATTLRPIEQAIQPPEPTAPPLAHPALAGLVNGGQPKRIRGGQNGRVPAQSPAR